MDNSILPFVGDLDSCDKSIVSDLTCEDIDEKSWNQPAFQNKRCGEGMARNIYSRINVNDIFSKSPIPQNLSSLEFNVITLSFYDNQTQKRFDKYFVTQNSWTHSAVLVAIPVLLLMSMYIWGTTMYFKSNISFSVESYYLCIAVYVFEGILTFLYLKFLKDMNSTCPLNKIVGINAVSSILSKLHRSNHAKVACDKEKTNTWEIDEMFQTEMINQDDREQKKIDLKVNRVLFSSLILGIFTIIFISAYSFILIKFADCTSMCIDNRIPSMEFLVMVLLPSYLAISISISWRSLLICSIICEVLIVLVFFIYGGESELFITVKSITEISYTWLFMCLLLWSQYRRYILQFIHCENIIGVTADIERKFASSNMLWMVPE